MTTAGHNPASPKRRRLIKAAAIAAGPGAFLVLAATTAKVTGWGWFWLAWVATGAGVELYWLMVNTANTLSRNLWGAEQLDFKHPLDLAEWTPLHFALTIVLWVLFGWLSVHFPFGWLR